MTDSPSEQRSDEPDAGDVPDEYRMSRGERPERIRRRNRITGIILVILIGTFVGITVCSRATSEDASYGVEEEARPPFDGDHQQPQPDDK